MPSNPKNTKVPDRYQALLDGTVSVSDLDDEELLRGQMRDKNGLFTGRPPLVIPRELHQAAMREWKHRIQDKMNGDILGALEALREITSNKRAPADARVKAANIILERVMGKVPDQQFIQAEVKKWDDNITDLIADVEE